MKRLFQAVRLLAFALAISSGSLALAQTPTLIQHVSWSNTDTTVSNTAVSAGGTYNGTLPNKTLAGNALVCSFTLDSTGPPTLSVQDDKGNTWVLGGSITDATHGVISAIYYSLNVAAGTSLVQVKFTGHSAAFVQVMVSEFNNVATVSAIDGNHGNFAAANTSITAGSFTTTTAGDLVYQFGNIDSGSATSFTQGSSPWNELSSDPGDGTVAQYQIQPSAGAINAAVTVAPASAFSSVAIALKAAAAGTARPSGIRIFREEHINTRDESSTPVTIQFPTTIGNLIVVRQYGGFDYRVSSISDSSGNSYTCPVVDEVTPDGANICYAKNVTTSAALALTFTMTGSNGGHGSTFILDEIVGADPTSPLDTGFATGSCTSGTLACANGNQTAGGAGGPVTTFTATPSAANELILLAGSMAADTETGWTSPTGAQQTATTYTGEANPAHADENNPSGIYYNGADTTAETWIFTHDTINSAGVGTWVVVGAAFKPAPGGSSITVNVSETLTTTDSVAPSKGNFRPVVQSAENRGPNPPLPARAGGLVHCYGTFNIRLAFAELAPAVSCAGKFDLASAANLERGPPA